MARTTQPPKSPARTIPWVYDTVLWVFSLLVDLFFREIQSRGAWKVPKKGPLIIVAGPHANQFVDSVVLMQTLKQHADRRISFLTAEKSMHEPYIGTLASWFGSLPVARAQDLVKPAAGKIYFPDPDGDPTLIRGIDTDFLDEQFMVKGMVVFPRIGRRRPAQGQIAKIISATELRLKSAVELDDELHAEALQTASPVPAGVSFKVAPHLDQTQVFNTAADHLIGNGCIGIFPEGGSHDRPDLLPLKAGVSIMALTTLAKDPDCGLTIVPCGMNYFHAHKFRSRAVVEFGDAIEVHPDQIDAFRAGGSQKRNAIGSLLETIHDGLTAVTQSCPDYETMMLAQATRRLYNPIGQKLPLSAVVELNRRLIKGYAKFEHDPRVHALRQSVFRYNQRLRNLGIKDHQVEWGDTRRRPWWLTLMTLMYRVGELVVLAVATLPGFLLFWPIFITARTISMTKQRTALAGSVVKVRGRDVVSTWKLLVSAGLAPILYVAYTVLMTVWLSHTRTHGQLARLAPPWTRVNRYVPDSIPLAVFSVGFLLLMIQITMAALRFGEIGADIFKSLSPLIVALNPFSTSTLIQLRKRRQALAAQVTKVINDLGPELFDNFDRDRIVPDLYKEGAYQSRLKRMELQVPTDGLDRERSVSAGLTPSSPFTFRTFEAEERQVDRRLRDATGQRGRERLRPDRDGDAAENKKQR